MFKRNVIFLGHSLFFSISTIAAEFAFKISKTYKSFLSIQFLTVDYL
jgi:hypothetical protein